MCVFYFVFMGVLTTAAFNVCLLLQTMAKVLVVLLQFPPDEAQRILEKHKLPAVRSASSSLGVRWPKSRTPKSRKYFFRQNFGVFCRSHQPRIYCGNRQRFVFLSPAEPFKAD